MTDPFVKTGLVRLIASPPQRMRRANLGLVANQASVGPLYEPAVKLIDRAFPGRLKKLFGPQHGFAGEKQDNMIESENAVEPDGGRPVYSLYGEVRRPTPDMLAGLDALLIDLVDVGTRVYTFAQTLALAMEAAAETGLKVVVLDRPNPIGGLAVEGNILTPACRSFVGMYPLPMRHGMTLGELALFMADRMASAPEMIVVKMDGWRREMMFADTGLPWVMPSPNMPTPETALVYPGQVIWEGTNVSEGRGTTRPFHLCGAPFFDSLALQNELDARKLPGCIFRPAAFEPTFHKFAGQVCHGLEIHPTQPQIFQPYLTSLTLLEIVMNRYPDHFAYQQPPYEYEYDRLPLDLIIGDSHIRESLERGHTAAGLEQAWLPALEEFKGLRENYLLY